MHEDLDRTRAVSCLVHLHRRQRRVLVDPFDLIAQVLERVMLEIVRELRRRSVDLHRFMDVAALPPAGPAVVEAHLVVGIEVRRPDPAAEMKRDARHAIAAMARLAREDRCDFAGERRRDALVGVEREDPVVRRLVGGEILLIDVAGPRAREHAHAAAARDRHRSIRAAGVDDEDLVGPGGGIDRRADVFLFVERDDRDRDRRHRSYYGVVGAPVVAPDTVLTPVPPCVVVAPTTTLVAVDACVTAPGLTPAAVAVASVAVLAPATGATCTVSRSTSARL